MTLAKTLRESIMKNELEASAKTKMESSIKMHAQPRVTQPGWVRFDDWVDRNQDLLSAMVEAFIAEIAEETRAPLDKSRIANAFLQYVYNNSSSSSKRWCKDYLT